METLPITTLTAIDILVHPDSSWMFRPSKQPPHQDLLHSRWNQRIQEVASNPNHGMFYISNLPLQEIQGAMVRGQFTGNRAKQIELDRIRQTLQTIPNRTILFGYPPLTSHLHFPTREQILSMLLSKRLSPDDNTQIYAYGEFMELCVGVWGRHILNELNLPHQNYHLLPNLSKMID